MLQADLNHDKEVFVYIAYERASEVIPYHWGRNQLYVSVAYKESVYKITSDVGISMPGIAIATRQYFPTKVSGFLVKLLYP